MSRNTQRYIYYKDYDGWYAALTNENVNPYWSGDYATVHFTYITPTRSPYQGKELYIIGQMTNYGKDEKAKLQWNEEKGQYETTLLLKQGYYDYAYALSPAAGKQAFNTDETEGNIWEAENEYTILVYYRELGGRYDQLVNVTTLNSLQNRPGQ